MEYLRQEYVIGKYKIQLVEDKPYDDTEHFIVAVLENDDILVDIYDGLFDFFEAVNFMNYKIGEYVRLESGEHGNVNVIFNPCEDEDEL